MLYYAHYTCYTILYYTLYIHVLVQVLALLKLSDWDPDVFFKFR